MTLGPLINVLHTPTLMASDEAIALASQLNSDTLEDWTYLVDADPNTGKAWIEVIDEDGKFISYM